MSKRILAVDVGYSNLKIGQTTADSEAQLAQYVRASKEDREQIDIEFNMAAMPAGALEKALLPDDAFGTGSRGIGVTVNGEEWSAGLRFTTNSKIRRHLTPDYKKSNEWKALFHAALLKSGWDEIDLLVMGLPCEEVYSPASSEVALLKEFATGEHEVSQGKKVSVKAVKIVAQPLGSIAGYFTADASKEEKEKMLDQSTTLIVDPGYYSCDVVVLHDGGIMKDSAFSTQHSVREICHLIEQKINQKFPDSPCQHGEVEEQIRRGAYTMPLKGKTYDFSSELVASCEQVALDAISEIESVMHTNNIHPRVTMLTGGGANLFAPTFKNKMHTDSVLVAKAPVMLNCFGFLSWGIRELYGK